LGDGGEKAPQRGLARAQMTLREDKKNLHFLADAYRYSFTLGSAWKGGKRRYEDEDSLGENTAIRAGLAVRCGLNLYPHEKRLTETTRSQKFTLVTD